MPLLPGRDHGPQPAPGACRCRTWEGYFSRWIRQPEPRELLDFNIFFDLRLLAGEPALVERLRARIARLLADNPPFFLHLARDALAAAPPLACAGPARGRST